MFQFGDKEKVWQLKLLNGSVYVRFGASVMPLDEFLANNDPCRGRFLNCYFVEILLCISVVILALATCSSMFRCLIGI